MTPSTVNEDIPSTWAQFHNVSTDNAKMVLLLTYQRTGSTFLSQFFNTDPLTFSYFEPLDSLYSSLYGTAYGWNVPSDITSHNDGSRRKLPGWEVEEVGNFLTNLLSCTIDDLPEETLFHSYQFMFSRQFLSTEDYFQCIRDHKIKLHKCRPKGMSDFCGSRFNQVSENRMNECAKLKKNPNNTEINVGNNTRQMFTDHNHCLKRLREKAREAGCLDKFHEACSSKTLRAVKTVRGTMDPVKSLMEHHPNLRIIHLIRDPRGVTFSRYKLNPSVRGIYSINVTKENADEALIREAEVYCRTVMDDVIKKEQIEKTYPGRILTILYDDLVDNTDRYVEKIHRFLDLPIEDDRTFAALSAKVSLNGEPLSISGNASLGMALKWRDILDFDVRLKILSVCKDFYTRVDYDWRL